MGIKLFVDDLRQPPDSSWVLVRTVTEAIRILDTQDVEVVALDHDIQHAEAYGQFLVTPYPCPETYEPVARHVALINRLRSMNKIMVTDPDPIRVTIHTANPAGEARMRDILGMPQRGK